MQLMTDNAQITNFTIFYILQFPLNYLMLLYQVKMSATWAWPQKWRRWEINSQGYFLVLFRYLWWKWEKLQKEIELKHLILYRLPMINILRLYDTNNRWWYCSALTEQDLLVCCMVQCTDFSKALFTLKCHMHTWNVNLIYAHNKSSAFPVLTFTKFRNVQLHSVQIIYTKFLQNQTINMIICVTVHLCPHIQYGFQCNDLYTTHTQYIFVGISCTKSWLRQKCKKCGQNFTHNKYSMAFTAPIFIKFTTTQCTNLLYLSVSKRVKKKKKLENFGKKPATPTPLLQKIQN